MRYRLRTLLILLAVVPPLLAGAWWLLTASTRGYEPVLFLAAILMVILTIAAEQ